MGCPTETAWGTKSIYAAGVLLVLYVFRSLIQQQLLRRKLNRWKKTQKNVVVLHGFPPGKVIPNLSPYVLKVETYLRLANIHYVWDRKDFFGPKGKSPWVTLNGEHVADSEFIIKFLAKKFEKDFSSSVSEQDLAQARVVRTMLEEFFACAIGLERMVYGSYDTFKTLGDLPFMFFYYLRYVLQNKYWEQGISRHSREEVTEIMSKNLKAVSTILGEKPFFGGQSICEEDCGIFSVLAQCLWALPDSPYEKLMNGECSNLKEYCLRVKEKLWADWNHCLAK